MSLSYYKSQQAENHNKKQTISAIRTAFVAKFILLRESKRSKAHRAIEKLCWDKDASAKDLYNQIREEFIKNGDKLLTVDKDLDRALLHAEGSANYFLSQYLSRECLSFKQALLDYERSNELLFGTSECPNNKRKGWKLSTEIK